MPTSSQDRDFACSLLSLDQAIDWIKNNLDPDQVFSVEQLKEWARDYGLAEPE
mgnify:CR=1 FL=1